MSERDPKLLLEDIWEAINSILLYTKDMTFIDFSLDKKTIDAVVRNFEIIGEASSIIPKEIKEKYHNINWKQIKGFRNRIVHEYFGIDITIVWNIIQNYLLSLSNQINDIYRDLK